MPTPTTDRPLTKVTLNLYTDDLLTLKRWHGNGSVSSVIRMLIAEHIAKHTKPGSHYKGTTKVYHSIEDYRND